MGMLEKFVAMSGSEERLRGVDERVHDVEQIFVGLEESHCIHCVITHHAGQETIVLPAGFRTERRKRHVSAVGCSRFEPRRRDEHKLLQIAHSSPYTREMNVGILQHDVYYFYIPSVDPLGTVVAGIPYRQMRFKR